MYGQNFESFWHESIRISRFIRYIRITSSSLLDLDLILNRFVHDFVRSHANMRLTYPKLHSSLHETNEKSQLTGKILHITQEFKKTVEQLVIII